MLISEFSKITGLSKDTIRFYEKSGILKPFKKANGYHHYSDELVQHAELIKMAKSLGFNLREIKDLRNKMFNGNLPHQEIRKYMEKKLIEVDEKIHALKKMRQVIVQKISECKI